VSKTDNLAACSIRALFEGKVRLPLTEVRKGLWSSSIRGRGSLESGAGASSTNCEWRSSMAWFIGSSRSAVKELAFSGGMVMSRWISSRNWRDSNPFSSGWDWLELDPANSPPWRREMALREEKKKEKKDGCGKKKGERNENKKGGERKYNCLINREG
jgi:hypothetical protein